MAKSSWLIFTCVFLIIAFSAREAFALKCWRCASDASTSAFCADPFDPSIISEQQRRWAYVDCYFPPNAQQNYGQQTSRPVCKKMEQLINDKIVTSRSCSWVENGTSPDDCMHLPTPSYIKTVSCSTCEEDGCNGQDFAVKQGIGFALTLIVATMLIGLNRIFFG